MEQISIDDFKKIEITVGEILSAERIEGSEKLLKLSVNFGEASPRQVLSGIAMYFPDIQVLVGKRYPFVTNLVPRTMMGLTSEAMILATGGGPSTELGVNEPFNLFETVAPAGAKAK